MPTKITYNGKTTELADGYIATLPCKDLKMETDVVIEAPEAAESGAELNIAYGDTAPEDTSKLWVKTSKPSELKISSQMQKTEGENLSFTELATTCTNETAGATAIAKDTKIYIFGGYKNLRAIQVFDTKTQTIRMLAATLQANAIQSGTALVDNLIYVFGGGDGSGTNTIACFDTETETVSTLTAVLPEKKAIQATTVWENCIYMCPNNPKYYCFDIDTQTVTTLTTTTTEVSFWGCSVDDGEGGIYHFGDYYGSDVILYFNAEAETITKLNATMPTENNWYAGIARIGTRIYLFGGAIETSNKTDTIRYFDSATKEVGVLDVTLSGVADKICAASANEKIYTFGGNYAPTNTAIYSNKIQCLSPDLVPLLESGKVQIIPSNSQNLFNLINTDTAQVEIGVNKVYKGNADGIGEEVEVALHNGTSWETI